MGHLIGRGRYGRETYPVPPPSASSSGSDLTPVHVVSLVNAGTRLVDVPLAAVSDGIKIYVLSRRATFVWEASNTETPDGNVIVSILANGATPGRFVQKLGEGDQGFRDQSTWHIGVAASAPPGTIADNDNDGLTLTTPIADGEELGRRLGGGPIHVRVTVFQHGTGVTEYAIDGTVVGQGALYVVGDRNVVASGTITAATPINRAAPGTRATITTAGTDFASHEGQRVRISGGNADARLDERFVIDADLGGNAARITRPLIPAPNRFTGLVPNGGPGTLPQNGDTFDIYTCPTINGYILLHGAIYAGTVSGSNGLILEDVDIGQIGPNRRMVISLRNASLFSLLISPRFSRAILQDNNVAGAVAVSPAVAGNCRCADITHDFYGGRIEAAGALQLITPGAQVYLDFDLYVEGAIQNTSGSLTIRAANLSLGTVGFFNAGTGLTIPAGATYQNTTNVDATHQLWGTVTGGGSIGIDVRSGGKLYIDSTAPTVTGASEFMIAGLATALNQNRATGAWTPGIACTWANWAANGNLVDPNSMSGIMRSA